MLFCDLDVLLALDPLELGADAVDPGQVGLLGRGGGGDEAEGVAATDEVVPRYLSSDLTQPPRSLSANVILL